MQEKGKRGQLGAMRFAKRHAPLELLWGKDVRSGVEAGDDSGFVRLV